MMQLLIAVVHDTHVDTDDSFYFFSEVFLWNGETNINSDGIMGIYSLIFIESSDFVVFSCNWKAGYFLQPGVDQFYSQGAHPWSLKVHKTNWS